MTDPLHFVSALSKHSPRLAQRITTAYHSRKYVDALELNKPILTRIFAEEGGYVNHPSDPGGETNLGITKQVAVAQGYNGAMRDLPIEVACFIYITEYFPAHRLPNPIMGEYVLFAINAGPRRATLALQSALHSMGFDVTVDGILGPQTARACNTLNPERIAARFCACMLMHYTDLSTFKTFGRGWVRRVARGLALF